MRLGKKQSAVRCAAAHLEPALWSKLETGDSLVLYAGESPTSEPALKLCEFLRKRGIALEPVRDISAQQTLHEGNALTRVFALVIARAADKATE
jgi:hypothetical protein